jgi:hypothetical protein
LSGGKKLTRWLADWGLAAMVGIAVLVAVVVAWTVAVPSPAPNFALKASAIYRIEIGTAAFLGIYLVGMAFALALNNRGFTDIGTSGLKAQDIANRAQQRGIEEQRKALDGMSTMVGDLEDFVEESFAGLNESLADLERKQAEEKP